MEIPWMKSLEEQAGAAAEEIERLRKQNRTLTSKVRKLEQSAGKRSASNAAGADWVKERQAIRRRVEKLTGTLEDLLG